MEGALEGGKDEREFAYRVLRRLRPFPRRFLVAVLEHVQSLSRGQRAGALDTLDALRVWGDEAAVLEDLIRARRVLLPNSRPRMSASINDTGAWQITLVATDEEVVVGAFFETSWAVPPAPPEPVQFAHGETFMRVRGPFTFAGDERPVTLAAREQIAKELEAALIPIGCSECRSPLRASSESDWILCLGCGGAFDHRQLVRWSERALNAAQQLENLHVATHTLIAALQGETADAVRVLRQDAIAKRIQRDPRLARERIDALLEAADAKGDDFTLEDILGSDYQAYMALDQRPRTNSGRFLLPRKSPCCRSGRAQSPAERRRPMGRNHRKAKASDLPAFLLNS